MARKYRVKAGDNLWDIAKDIFGDGRGMKRLMAFNGMKSTIVRPGMVLKIPAIMKGRNDQFRIYNKDLAQGGILERANSEGSNLGFQSPETAPLAEAQPDQPPTRQDRLEQQGIQFQDTRRQASGQLSQASGPISSMAQQYAGQYVQGQTVAGPGGFVDSNKDAPFQTPATVSKQREPGPSGPVSVQSGSAQQYIPEEYQIQQPPSQNQGAPFQTPATIGFTAEVGPGTQAINAVKEALGQIVGAFGSGQDVANNAYAEVWDEFSDPVRDLFGGKPDPTGSFSGAGTYATTQQMVDGLIRDGVIDPENLGTGGGTFSETSIRRWQNYDDSQVNYYYGMNLANRVNSGEELPRIPSGAVHNTAGGFGFTPEQLRLMGYTLSEDGEVYEPYTAPGFEQPGTGDAGLGSGGGLLGGPGGGGYGGGVATGIPGNRVGPKQQGKVASAGTEAVLRGAGSWKGQSFG